MTIEECKLDSDTKDSLLAVIVDILYAYHYDLRMRGFTQASNSSETNLNIVKLSSTLSAFVEFPAHSSLELKLRATYVSCMRRALCFTLYRSYDLAAKVFEDLIE